MTVTGISRRRSAARAAEAPAARGARAASTRTPPRADAFDGSTRPARAARAASAEGTARAEPVKFRAAGEYRIDVPEPSGITFLSPAEGFLVVSDCEDALFRVPVPEGRGLDTETLKLKADGGKKHLTGLEGVAYDRQSRSVLVLSEDRNQVGEVSLDRRGLALGKAEKLGELPDISRTGNKGFEGLALLPGANTPDGKPRLLAIHEGDPRKLVVMDRRTLHAEGTLSLTQRLKDHLADLADVAVDPRTGHLFLLSDESAAVAEVELVATRKARGGAVSWDLRVVGTCELPYEVDGKRLQPEGLAFDDKGDLWVVAEKKRSLFHLARD
ncbi:MAG: SdiA-regulated domain-containing protein [Deltaproteobacteria bacterium]|nr:SdiA-regulated domain-containing protein [Deltaproteobacteria bacterium]